MQSHAPQHADARHRSLGPLRVVSNLRTTWRHGFRRDLTRFRTQNLAAAKIFRKFRSEIRCESHAISRAAACQRSGHLLGTSQGREQAAHHLAARISARFRTQNFAAAKIFENFGPKSAPNRTQSHAAQHADARNRCWGPLRVVTKLRTTRRHGFRRDLTRFRMKNFAAAQNFRNFRSEIARNLMLRSMLMLGTVVWDL